jgi:hypothetical protein
MQAWRYAAGRAAGIRVPFSILFEFFFCCAAVVLLILII